MDRNGKIAFSTYLALIIGTLCIASTASAQHHNRLAYNPMTGQMVPDPRLAPRHSPQPAPVFGLEDFQSKDQIAQPGELDRLLAEPGVVESEDYFDELEAFVEPSSHCDLCGCDDDCCGDCLGCGEAVDCCPCPPKAAFFAGFEATFLKPRFEDNVAFTTMESDGATFESFTDTQFDYDLELSPRVFLGWRHGNGLGLRATWWQFDHAAAAANTNPPANGMGLITHPPFGDIEVFSEVPTDTFTASTDLNAYTIDLEATKGTHFGSWELGVAGGIRYAYIEQSYFAQLRNNANTLRGQINFRHSLEGIGPTISLAASRPLYRNISLLCGTRASVLFGDGESTLVAVEDADLATALNTSRTTNRDDLLSIGEIQVGLQWQAARRWRQIYRPFLSVALEGQIWNGAGNATSEEGTLGFLGINSGVGVGW